LIGHLLFSLLLRFLAGPFAIIRAARQQANGASPSLRANGSRECAPDDRLREAIQLYQRKSWIASSQVLLAMT
jgi:hypothetical protein